LLQRKKAVAPRVAWQSLKLFARRNEIGDNESHRLTVMFENGVWVVLHELWRNCGGEEWEDISSALICVEPSRLHATTPLQCACHCPIKIRGTANERFTTMNLNPSHLQREHRPKNE